MGLRINTNLQALTAHKNLTKTDAGLSQSLERLSSGLRINKAADDASGLAIADNLRAQHTGIGQAISNANDGVNIIQIADGALEESINIVTTIRTKAIQAASDAQSSSSRKAIQADVNKLLEELQMIGETTAYNGLALLDGSFINKSFHVGAYKDETVGVNIGDARATKIGAMAYAKTNREAEAAVSNPFVKGSQVTAEAISEGDLRINGIQIGATIDQQTPIFSATGFSSIASYGSSGTAFAKAAAINAKINETGVAAKATTELTLNVVGSVGATDINSINLVGANNNVQVASIINNSSLAEAQGIRAEIIDGTQVRIIAEDGRNLSVVGAAAALVSIGGASIAGLSYTQRGTLTLSNARSMTNSEAYVKADTINTGDLIINGVDVAAAGSLTILKGDTDHTLVNAINNNKELQTLGIRAELYKAAGDSNEEFRLRLISANDTITISGNAPGRVGNLIPGTTQGIKTTGIVLEGSATDSDPTSDNYLRTIGFDGALFGTSELNGASNSGGNDVAVVSKAYLKSSQVTAEAISSGDLLINGIQIGATVEQHSVFGSVGTAFAKAAAINAKTNETGVAAKATTELVLTVGGNVGGSSMNSIDFASATTNVQLASVINNNSNAKAQGIRAETVGTNDVRIIAEDGRNLDLTASALATITINGANMSGLSYSQRGALTFTNSRAMVNSESYITAGSLNQGELVINGIDVARGGSLTILQGDLDHTLVNAINGNNDFQKLGIRAELYQADGDVNGEYRLRLISDRDPITVGGTDPSKIAKIVLGTTNGTASSELNIRGALVDSNLTADNYLRMIGLDGAMYGTSEETGVSNSGGNDKIVFGQDRLNYNSGDVSVNGYKIGLPTDDGISTAMGDKSAAAWAAAVNLVKLETGVEADIIKAEQTGAGMVRAGILKQRDLVINGVDIVRDNTGGDGMEIKDADAGQILMKAINEYKDQTGVLASIDKDGKLVLSAIDGRNIHVQSTATGNKFVKFEADFGIGKGIAQDSVYMGNIRLVADEGFTVDGAGSSASSRELSLLKMGLAGGGAATDATSDLKGDGTLIAGINYNTSIANADVTTQQGAEMVIRSADYAIKRLDTIRSGLGSTQNQLTSTVANLAVTKINVQSTESTIRDVDFAQESSVFSKMQVLMQAGTYAQSQANASAQNVMRLLQ